MRERKYFQSISNPSKSSKPRKNKKTKIQNQIDTLQKSIVKPVRKDISPDPYYASSDKNTYYSYQNDSDFRWYVDFSYKIYPAVLGPPQIYKNRFFILPHSSQTMIIRPHFLDYQDYIQTHHESEIEEIRRKILDLQNQLLTISDLPQYIYEVEALFLSTGEGSMRSFKSVNQVTLSEVENEVSKIIERPLTPWEINYIQTQLGKTPVQFCTFIAGYFFTIKRIDSNS